MQLPKDCYYLSDVLIKKIENQHMLFDDAMQELTKPGYWVEIDWSASTRLERKEIRSTPMLMVSHKHKTIQRSFANLTAKQIGNALRSGGKIFLSATVVERWGYKKKK